MPVGFYGKLPSHSDFLHRGVTDVFINHWDAWLQESLSRSRSDLGEAWLDVFLTSPLWRFALGSGVVGGAVWAGILLPSVDRVGRYFPLTIVAELAPGVLPFELSVAGNGWFDWAEALARRTLDDELVDLDRLQSELGESEALLAAVRPAEHSPEPMRAEAAPDAWYALAADGDMGRFFARFAQLLAPASREPLGLWWSTGSDRMGSSVMMSRGLPQPSSFRELLGAALGAAPPAAVPVEAALPAASVLRELLSGVPLPAPSTPTATSIDSVLPALASVSWQSSAVSDAGRVRDENQDAFVERSDAGLWLVADGMGGHEGGKMASELIAQGVKRLAPTEDLQALARDVARAIATANTELRSVGEVRPGFAGGSTVVTLCARGAQGIALWAGDSRLYRLRGAELEQLTRDHSVGEEEDGAPADQAHMLTRAVGGADLLTLGELRLEFKPGDRLLLCSDGLYGDLTPEEIAAALAAPDCASAAQALLALALERGGTDNATAVVIAVSAA